MSPSSGPSLPAVLAGPGPFVGRGHELERLLSAYQLTLAGGTGAVLIAGEPGVGKTRLAGEWSRQAFEQGAVVLYGRCDEDLGAPYQPFAEALRSLVPCLGADRVRGLRGVEALLPLVPGLTDALPDLAAPPRADPDTERYALFDAVVALLGIVSTSAPVVLILDDLHWAAKPTLLLLRHLLRFGEHARIQILGTYRSTDLDRSHPLAAMLADLHRDGSAHRLQLSGLDEDDVSAYVAEAGYDDEELARALASVTGGNPFFLIEALRHVDESGGRWDPSTLPQGVREAVSRRLSRLPVETNKALAAAAVVGSRFALALVESVVGEDLIDAFDEASKAGIVIEEPGGRYRFNHAIVRQSLLTELASVRRMRLHQRIAATLEADAGADDELLAELAYHYFECAWAGNAAKAVEYCRRAADQAMARLAYEGAADLYDKALHALEEIDDELPDRDDQQAELLVARCEALLAAGDVVSATGAVAQLQAAASDSARLAAWGTCFDGQLSMLTHPERLDEIESALSAAAEKLAGLEDAAGEAKAHTVRAGCLARLGRIGDAETALDQALTAARRAREHRRVNNVLANAPLAALWGPNPVPRAGGRCLDVIRLLRITTGSPVVEATSTRCQGVLDAFRGRAAAGRALIDSARRTLTELGMRHALLEVDQFAGIVELVADDPAAAEPHLRRAYNGFRRMGLDADTAETAALLARACLALGRDTEADELCTESERLAGHALKASIAWRTVRAELSARSGAHDEARRVAEEAVAVAARTDLLVDHGDACLALATVLKVAGDAAGARAAAEQAVGLYELKGAAALAEKARKLMGGSSTPATPTSTETPVVEPENACVRAIRQLIAAVELEAWDEVEQLFAPKISVESRRKIVGFPRTDLSSREWPHEMRRFLQTGMVRFRLAFVAVRGERLALFRLQVGTEDSSPGAPQDELLRIFGLDVEGRIALQVSFDIEDMDDAMAELDAAHARLQERPPLENAASRLHRRLWTHFLTREWEALAETMTDDAYVEDHRPVVNYGLLRGRDAVVEALRVDPDLGLGHVTPTVVATRGERLVLSHLGYSPRDKQPEAFHLELITVVEIDDDSQMTACVVYDAADSEAAFAELDARYLAGEAAPFAHVWQSAMDTLDEANRHEPGPNIRGFKYVDHRRVSFGSGNFGRAVEELWALVPDARYRVTAVHALDAHGTVASLVIEGTDSRGHELQWSRIVALLPGEPRMEVYEEDDLEAALARFEELRPQVRQLDNAATRFYERFRACLASRDWAAFAELLATEVSTDDRRRVVNAGVRHGRDAVIAEVSALTEIGLQSVTSDTIAIRGERLALSRIRSVGDDQRNDAFYNELLDVLEIDADERVVARVVFDVDDIEAAVEELDARYLACEAAAHAHTWSVITRGNGALNRREIPATTPDWVNMDHRRVAAFAPGEGIEYIRAGIDLDQNIRSYVEVVHRLSDLGAVFTWVGHGTSNEGFAAEWRGVNLITVDGEMVNRAEVFDEIDLDAALAKFEQLSRPAVRLENAATKVEERFQAYFAARDWAAMGEILADDISADDRRRVVNAGIRHGRDAKIADMRATADLGTKNGTSTVIATRGRRLALVRIRLSGRDQRPDAFHTEMLGIAEIDADNRMAARVLFDVDDIDAAFEELDTRYLAGEAAAHAHTWSVITGAFAAVNHHDLPGLTPGWVNVDHRRAASFAPGELAAYTRATWEQLPDVMVYVEAVHRLTDFGAVVTQMASGTSQEGFHAEWHESAAYTVEDDRLSRVELFDEEDIDAALATFDELSRPAPSLENAASQVWERLNAYFTSGDWAAMSQSMAQNMIDDDRRRTVNGGIRRGKDIQIANGQAVAETGADKMMSTVIAVRGERLALCRSSFFVRDQQPGTFRIEFLSVIEIDVDEQLVAHIGFDLDNIDAAFEELDARYLAEEAAAHAQTWSLVTGAYAALNRREVPATTPDWVNIDHRRGRSFAPGDMIPYIRAMWNVTPDLSYYAVAVHKLSNIGAVVSHAGYGTSQQGFDAEWREIVLLTFEGDLVDRCETFDESDLDAAIARFEVLHPQTPRLENTASQVCERFNAYFAERDWAAMAAMLASDIFDDDRRRVVNAGTLRGRDDVIADVSSLADIGAKNVASEVIAIRGARLVLSRARYSGSDERQEAFHVDALDIVEIDADERLVAHVAFDLDDIDAAFEELDARYVAGEAGAYAHTWSVIARGLAAFNRREMPGFTPDLVDIDHRRARRFAPGDLTAYIGATWDLAPDVSAYAEAVHRLSNLGAVWTHAVRGTSQDGFDAEWREICLATVEGDLISRIEMFDEEDIDAALAKFDELSRPVPRLENAATRLTKRFQACFAAGDWDAMAGIFADDISTDDRRPVLTAGTRHGRDTNIEDWRTVAEVGLTDITSTVVATRGNRLALSRFLISTGDQRPEAFHNDVLGIVEINADNRISAGVMFDLDDIEAAFDELDARYLAGEGADHSRVWSVIADGYAALNRHDLTPTAPDWVNIDHRRGIAFAPGDMAAYLRTSWDVAPDITIYIEAVHRLSDLGAVVTHVANGTSREGFAAEWRVICPSDGRRQLDQPQRAVRRGRPRCRARAIRRTRPTDTEVAKRGKPSFRPLKRALHGARLASNGGDGRRRHDRRRSSTRGECWPPTGSRCPNRRSFVARRGRGKKRDLRRHRDPGRAPRPQSCSFVGR